MITARGAIRSWRWPRGVEIAYDALATGAGIMPGASLSGFAVEFNWLGTGAPGTQRLKPEEHASGRGVRA